MNLNQPEIRLNKRLVQMRLAPSRRMADELITSGNVKINGQVTYQLGQKVYQQDHIQVGPKIGSPKTDIYIAFNKPVGYLSSHRSQGQSPNIFSLMPKTFSSLKIAGRLDKDSSGLLLLSSDGDFVERITHPSVQKPKIYLLKIDHAFDGNDKAKLLRGVALEDGISRIDHLRMITPTRLRVTIHTGRKRQLRRMFKHLDYTILELERVQIGVGLTLVGIKPGQYRFLTKREVDQLCQ